MAGLLNDRCRLAWEKILSDENLRVWLWCLLAEDCRSLSPGESPSARDIGLRLMEDAKAVSLDAVHKAEAEYRSLVEMDRKSKNENGDYYDG